MSTDHQLRRALYAVKEARLRAFWRISATLVIALTVYIGGQLLIPVGFTTIVPGIVEEYPVGATLSLLGLLTGVIVFGGWIGLIVAVRLGATSIERFGFDLSSDWMREFLGGIGIGLAATVGALGYVALRGYGNFVLELRGVGVDSLPIAVLTLVIVLGFFLANNIFEEVLFRPVLVKNAAEGLRAWGLGTGAAAIAALAVSMPVFGALHLLGGGTQAVITSIVAGALFGTAYLLTGQLALPIGVHFGGVAFVSVVQQPVSMEPELTLPAIVVAENLVELSLVAGVEIWVVRMAIGVLLILAWVYLSRGDIAIDERIYTHRTA